MESTVGQPTPSATPGIGCEEGHSCNTRARAINANFSGPEDSVRDACWVGYEFARFQVVEEERKIDRQWNEAEPGVYAYLEEDRGERSSRKEGERR